MTELIKGHDLSLLRGDRCLFRSLDFALGEGELLVVEGPNGSGKTSLLRGLAGLLEFETGSTHWRGQPFADSRQAFRAEIAWLSHKVGCKADLTLVDNLRFDAGLRATSEGALAPVLSRLGLTHLTELPMRSLSAGQQRRVALARLLRSSATLWLMDEPFTNLDRDGQALIEDLISEHLGQGGACIVATHHALDVAGNIRRVTLT